MIKVHIDPINPAAVKAFTEVKVAHGVASFEVNKAELTHGYNIGMYAVENGDTLVAKSATALAVYQFEAKRKELLTAAKIAGGDHVKVTAGIDQDKQTSAALGAYETDFPGFNAAVSSLILSTITAYKTYKVTVMKTTVNTIAKLAAVPAPTWPTIPQIIIDEKGSN